MPGDRLSAQYLFSNGAIALLRFSPVERAQSPVEPDPLLDGEVVDRRRESVERPLEAASGAQMS